MTGYPHHRKDVHTTGFGRPRYALCEDVELIRQPYGAALWKQSLADFAITNDSGRIILEACDKQATLEDIVREVSSGVGAGVNAGDLKSDIEEFLASAK